MTNLLPYLVFPGNCRDAMQFYVDALNGDITSITTYEDSPLDVAEDLKYRIFDCEFRTENVVIKASDNLPQYEVQNGNNISLFLSFSDKKLRKDAFTNLSEDGNIMFPLDENFGMLKDKYGIQWMFTSR